jgi:dihydroflavonol-4-reductase
MRSKYEAQMLVMDFVKNYNLPAIVVNPTFMLGKYDIKPSSGQLPLMAWGKQVMPCPPGGKNFIHVNDVASGIIQSIRQGKPGNCYLMGNENLSYQEFFRKMKAVCGFPKHLIPIPGAWIMAAGQAGSLYERLSGKISRLNHANAPLLCAGNYYTARKAIKELQLPQTPIEQAISDALEWFEAYGYLKK